MVKRIIRQAFASAFIRNATLLSSGVVLAQLIPLLTLPVFSRMFEPGYFALHALLLMGMAILTPIATGFYEWAIPIPRQQAQSRSLATLAMLFSMALCSLLMLLLYLFPDMAALLQVEKLGFWIYAVPVLIFATAIINVSNYWLLRRGKLLLQSINRTVLTAGIALCVFIFGLMKAENGLLLGFVAGTVLAAIWSAAVADEQGLAARWPLKKRYTKLLLYKYREFPLFGSIPAAVQNFALYLPVLLVTANYALDTSGHYAVTRNLMIGGLGLVAMAIGQVVLKHVAELAQERQRIWPHYLRMLGLLLGAGTALTVTVYAVGPWFFTFYLGEGWEDTALIARLLSFNLALWLAAPALSQALVALRQVKAVAAWQMLYGASACGLMFFTHLPFEQFLTYVVVFELAAYGLFLAIVTLVLWRLDKRHFSVAFTSAEP